MLSADYFCVAISVCVNLVKMLLLCEKLKSSSQISLAGLFVRTYQYMHKMYFFYFCQYKEQALTIVLWVGHI